jgi:ATP-dependent DNA helicase RecG
MPLPINIRELLRGKSVEWERLHDELVVLSYPGPDRSVRLEQLRAGKAMPRRYRNRRIGEFLKELEFTEGRSTGIPKIIDTMQANGSPPAEFDFDKDHSYFMVRLPVHPAALEVADSEAGEFAEVDTLQVNGQVTGQVQRLLAVCNGVLSRAELQEKLGLRHRDNFIEAYLQPALYARLLEMTIPDKPRSSKQKYRLTEQGHAVLTSLKGLESRHEMTLGASHEKRK